MLLRIFNKADKTLYEKETSSSKKKKKRMIKRINISQCFSEILFLHIISTLAMLICKALSRHGNSLVRLDVKMAFSLHYAL